MLIKTLLDDVNFISLRHSNLISNFIKNLVQKLNYLCNVDNRMSKFYQIFTRHALIRSIRWPNDISDLKCNSYMLYALRGHQNNAPDGQYLLVSEVGDSLSFSFFVPR